MEMSIGLDVEARKCPNENEKKLLVFHRKTDNVQP